MTMDTESDICPENADSKHAALSPSTHSEISTDGDGSVTQSNASGSDKICVTTEVSKDVSVEPKMKKRRKQSKPLKCQSSTSTIDMPLDDLELSRVEEQEFHQDFEQNSNAECTVENLSSDKVNNNEQKPSSENMSQKNILSQMNEMMLYGNMTRGNNITSQTNHKNKSSLHLLTEMTSPDSNEEISRNIESKNAFPNFYSQMPPLLPINPSDFAGELSKFTNVFCQMPELPTQLMQTSLNITPSNRSFITSNGVRVFNPEAYCELCEKEFCNKYFLKTHKANKHGVCSVDNSSFLHRTSFKTSPAPIAPQMINQMNENSSHNTADAYCNICQKSFCNKYFLKKHRHNIHGIVENGSESSTSAPNSIHVPVISSLPSLHLPSVDYKFEGSSLEQTLNNPKNNMNGNSSFGNLNGLNLASHGKSKSFLPNKNGKELETERFLCELCNIEFRDKHYLNTHKLNKHGAGISPKAGQEFVEFSEIGKIENVEKLSKIPETSEVFNSQTCIPCMKNFTSTESFHNHMLEVHGATVKEENDNSKQNHSTTEKNQNAELPVQSFKKSFPENDNSDSSSDSDTLYCSMCFMKFKDKSSLQIHFESVHNLNESFSHTNGSSDTKESSALNSLLRDSNLKCDACPDRFPNKHILMSHRLKVHGIISPMSEPHCNSTDIDTMNRIEADYSSLLSGKHNVGTQSFCRICNKELCNKYFMKTHMLKRHGIDVDKLCNERFALKEKNVSCDICHKVLSSKSFLKQHRLNAHGISDEMNKVSVPSESPLDSSGLESLNKNDVPSENSHTSEASNEQSKGGETKTYSFSCEICSQEFPSKLLLQVHLVNKHVNNNESRVTNLGGLIGLSIAKTEARGKPLDKENDSCKEPAKVEKSCSCCSPITAEGKPATYGTSDDGIMLLCHICNISYHPNSHYQHHLAHMELMVREANAISKNANHISDSVADSVEMHDVDSDKIFIDDGNQNRFKPRKFKRFRCSKCDKTFRTRNKCLHHIQVMHKNKKGAMNHTERFPISEQPSPKKDFLNSIPKTITDKKEAALFITQSDFLSEINEKKTRLRADDFQQSSSLPVPYVLPKNSQDVIMQPFHLTEPKTDDLSKPDVFVPSLVYLPVSKKVSEPVTVAFTLTPA